MKTKKQPTKKTARKTKAVKMGKKFTVKDNFKVTLKEKPETQEMQHVQQTNKVTYWIALAVITTCNLIAAIFLIPFLMMLPQWPMYLLVVAIAIVFGLLFNLIIRDISVGRKHQILALTFIPIVTVINLFLMALVANKLDDMLGLAVKHSPTVISLLYAVVFLLPYAFDLRKKR